METASAIRKFRRAVRLPAGHKRSTGKPAKKRTAGAHSNGFLNHSFEPFWGIAFANWRMAEQAFFTSAVNLCALYGWTMPEVSGLSFPENISTGYKAITAQQPRDFGLQVAICQDEKHACCLTTAKTFDTDYHLYYIPVRPLWTIRDVKAERPLYNLLVSVFSYLYQVAGVPFFTEPGTIDSNYETIENWLDEEMEQEPYWQRQTKELKELKKAGEAILPEIQKQFSWQQLQGCLRRYQKSSNSDQNLSTLAEELIKLIRDYPKRALRDNMYYEEEEEDNNTIYWEQYISFYWSGSDCLAETLYRMVNDDFQEMCYQEEPVCRQWFDQPQEKACHNFDYEPRLFSLIDRLAEILNDYDYEEPNE